MSKTLISRIKNLIFRFWPIIFIFFVWFIFASPYFLRGSIPFASTYQVNNFAPWDAYQHLWGPVKNGAMPDVITQIYPWRHLAIEIWKSGQIPLWNPYSFSGTPLLANYQSAVLSPFNLLFFLPAGRHGVLPFVDGWSILVLLQPLLAGIFMYLFVRGIGEIRVSRVGALISSISFMFCGFITVWMGYATLGYAILFLPLALFCIEKYHKTQKNKFLILLSFTIPLSFFSGHFQISLYFFFAVLAYITYKFFVTKSILNTLYLILYTFFGLLLSMPQVLPSFELYSESFRSSFFQKGGIPFEYLPTFLAPDFFGNPVTRNDWFGYYAEWNGYIGIISLMLAIYSFLRIKKPRTFFLFFFGIFVLILAFNNPISNFILSFHLPVFSTTVINRLIVLYSFAFAILAGFGIDQLILDIKNINKGKIIVWLGLFNSLFIILWFIVFQRLFIPIDKVFIAKQNLILPTILFLSAFFAIIFCFAFQKNKYGSQFLRILPYFILLLVAFDMLRFAKKWQPFDPKNLAFANLPTIDAFSKIAGFNRVLGNFGGEASVYYHLSSVEGYDAMHIKRYAQFAGFIEKDEFIKSSWSVVSFPKNGQHTGEAINLLDIKYIVHKLKDDHAGWTFPFWRYPKDQFKLIYKDSEYEFYINTKAVHAFLVGKYKVIKDPQKILDTMFSKSFDLRKEIILEEDPKIKISDDSIGSLDIVNYTPNKITIKIDAQKEGLLFLADSYFKGWKAQVDGKDAPIYRADFTFRAMPINKGKHLVIFNYIPWSFRVGLYFGFIGMLGIGITILIPKILNRLK